MDTLAETRVRRLAEALASVSKPLLPLLEYADDLEKHLDEHDEMGLLCLAALLRVRAREARNEIAQTLAAVEEAANRVVSA